MLKKATGYFEAKTRHYYHLVMLNVLFAVLCIPTAGKTIDIGGIPQSISIFFFPLVYIAADLLTEVYGYVLARRAIWYSVAAQIIAMVIFQIVAVFPPSATMTNNDAFQQILSQAPFLVTVGLIATFVGDIVNNFVLAKMKISSDGKHMGARFVVSTIAGEFVNTFIFYFGALVMMGILPASVAMKSTLLAATLKTIVEVVLLPITLAAAKKLKKIEDIDIYDKGTDFNPLKF